MHGRQPSDFKLDMPFDEAMERFAGANPREMHANIKKSKQKKPPGTRRKKPSPGGKAKNVVSLRERKTRLRAKGLA
jgi:hypothetical protein